MKLWPSIGLKLVAASFCLALCSITLAQEDNNENTRRVSDDFINPMPANTVIRTNPLLIIWGTIPLTSEYMVLLEFTTSSKQSSQIGISYLDKTPLLRLVRDSVPDIEQLIVKGGRFQISHKFYVLRKGRYAPKGFYVSPHASFATAKISTKLYNSRGYFIRISHFNVNILCGWQWLLGNKFAIDVYSGWGYKDNFWEEHNPQNTISVNTEDMGDIYNSKLKFSLGFSMGLAF